MESNRQVQEIYLGISPRAAIEK